MADQGSEGLLSSFLRSRRLKAAQPLLNGKVLDVGCGSGALAAFLSADSYVGVEIDDFSLRKAAAAFKQHRFVKDIAQVSGKFDTVVSLAVIEHVDDPVAFLNILAGYCDENDGSRLIITTPHPAFEWIHRVGAGLGIFSKHAGEEHKMLLNRRALRGIGRQAGLKMTAYRRFLFGANQLAVFEKE